MESRIIFTVGRIGRVLPGRVSIGYRSSMGRNVSVYLTATRYMSYFLALGRYIGRALTNTRLITNRQSTDTCPIYIYQV